MPFYDVPILFMILKSGFIDFTAFYNHPAYKTLHYINKRHGMFRM